MNILKNISGGIYLILDPSKEEKILFERFSKALRGHIDVVQIWDNWPQTIEWQDRVRISKTIKRMSAPYEIPVLVNKEWRLLKETNLDGVHFDVIPENYEKIKKEIGRAFLCGITCNNDLDVVRWADRNGLAYISFCAMFPSVSVDSCEIVRPETVQKAQKITRMPIFLSGGITKENIADLRDMTFHGIAVISGVMNADDPEECARSYNKHLKEMHRAT